MTETIQALHDEIEAAEKERDYFQELANSGGIRDITERQARLTALLRQCYIDGLQTAVRLLEQEPARELPIPFTAENGDCSFLDNGDLR